jgi:serine/threonine-protein kinase
MSATILAERFRLDRQLAAGPRGLVYAGTDLRMNRAVTIKLPAAATLAQPADREAWRARLAAAAAVSHPALPAVYDFDLEAEQPYVVTARADGRSLAALLAAGETLAPEDAARLGQQAAEALAALHRAGLTHGSLTPESLLLTDDGALWLLDAEQPPAPATSLEAARYAAPEVLCGASPEPAADVYALAAVLYHGLAGQPPFDAPDLAALSFAKQAAAPPALDQVRPEVAALLATAIDAALSRDPAQRPASAAALAQTLGRPESAVVVPTRAPLDRTTIFTPTAAVEPAVVAPPPTLAPTEDLRSPQPSGGGCGPLVSLLLVVGIGLALFYGLKWARGVEVPALAGKSEDQALAALQTAGLKGTLAGSEFDDTVPDGQVVRQDPGAGSRLAKDGTVKITLSKGSRYVEVPTLSNLSEREAGALLAKVGLKVGGKDYAHQAGAPDKVVVAQNPAGGTKVDRGSAVGLILNQRPKDAAEPDKSGGAAGGVNSVVDQTLDKIKDQAGKAVGDELSKAKEKTREGVKNGLQEAEKWLKDQFSGGDKGKADDKK